MPRTFSVTDEQQARVQKWLMEEVYPEVIKKQKASMERSPLLEDCWKQGFPYGGAIGGDVTYEFTPNSIGITEKVRAYDKELDLTDYESW